MSALSMWAAIWRDSVPKTIPSLGHVLSDLARSTTKEDEHSQGRSEREGHRGSDRAAPRQQRRDRGRLSRLHGFRAGSVAGATPSASSGLQGDQEHARPAGGGGGGYRRLGDDSAWSYRDRLLPWRLPRSRTHAQRICSHIAQAVRVAGRADRTARDRRRWRASIANGADTGAALCPVARHHAGSVLAPG